MPDRKNSIKKDNPKARVCPWYMAYFFDNPLRRLIYNTDKLFSPYLKAGMTAVDIGCGMGFNTIGMAGIVGSEGCVIAVDLQKKMLDITMKRAWRKGVDHIIRPHLCSADSIGIEEQVDFILAFWVVHELPDVKHFMAEVRAMLKPEAKFLMVEPRHHVSDEVLASFIKSAEEAGLKFTGRHKISMSRAALFSNR